MKIETSTKISGEDIAKYEKQLRQAAVESKNDRFFSEGEKIEVVNSPDYPSVEVLAAKAGDDIRPMGDPTLCGVAYAVAQGLCGGNPICLAIAAVAYQKCLDS